MNRIPNIVFVGVVIIFTVVVCFKISSLDKLEDLLPQIYSLSYYTWVFLGLGILLLITILDNSLGNVNKVRKEISETNIRLDVLIDRLNKAQKKDEPTNYEVSCPHCQKSFDLEV